MAERLRPEDLGVNVNLGEGDQIVFTAGIIYIYLYNLSFSASKEGEGYLRDIQTHKSIKKLTQPWLERKKTNKQQYTKHNIAKYTLRKTISYKN